MQNVTKGVTLGTGLTRRPSFSCPFKRLSRGKDTMLFRFCTCRRHRQGHPKAGELREPQPQVPLGARSSPSSIAAPGRVKEAGSGAECRILAQGTLGLVGAG